MRKNKYRTHVAPFLKEIGQMAADGATEAEIAAKLRVAYSTFKGYKHKHRELQEVLLTSKELADLNVEAALYRRAEGYKTREVTRERRLNRQTGEYELIETKVVEKEVPPDTTAIQFWLKNRKPEEWREHQSIAIAGMAEEQSKLAELLRQRREGTAGA